MKILIIENTLEATETHKVAISVIKEQLSEKYGAVFQKVKDGEDDEDIIYEYNDADKNMWICVRTIMPMQDKEMWVNRTKELINKYIQEQENLYLLIHLGCGGREPSNYAEYPAINALIESNINEDNVIVYSAQDTSKSQFLQDTGKNYSVVVIRDVGSMIDRIIANIK